MTQKQELRQICLNLSETKKETKKRTARIMSL